MSDQAAVSNVVSEAASRGTLVKLVIFSISLGVAPLASYYGSLKYLWNGNSTFAAITAIVAANIILVGYIISALFEEKPIGQVKTAETKKDR